MRTTSLPIHMATTGKQLAKLQVYENKFVRRIARSRLKWKEWKENGRRRERMHLEWRVEGH